ncbi:MAG: PglZ domain-containing protein [Chloroflexota bacterium]
MKIKEFIQTQIILPRLQQHGVLVVYDPERRYRELCLDLAGEKRRVIDATDSSIASRLAALQALQEFGAQPAGAPHPAIEAILVYVPAPKPRTEAEKRGDPFAAFGACGGVFPDGDGDGYQSLCLKARADDATQIYAIFKNDPNPPFAVIDAVGGGAGWPNLQARFGVTSARELLFALLTPTPAQLEALNGGASGQEAWAAEVRALCRSTLGLDFTTHANSWSSLADELWRFLLFSEFAFDLPVDLPAGLATVKRAPSEARVLVEDLCSELRGHPRSQAAYIERAEEIQGELDLPGQCREMQDFGVKDTFPFEERAGFTQAVEALLREQPEKLALAIERHARSVWVGRGENQAQWALLQAAARLVQACDDAEARLAERPEQVRSLEALIETYTQNLREVDRLQREFEHAAGERLFIDEAAEKAARDMTRQARQTYRRLADRLQGFFLKGVEKSGWPHSGRLSNGDVFDKLVAPRLSESGRRVALVLIDALRYELGVELAKQLGEAGQVELQASCALLPSVTPVGMAALLPGAGLGLMLRNKDGGLGVELDGQALLNVNQRIELLRSRYGQRFAGLALDKFCKEPPKLERTVELLLLRSNDMDSAFEADPETAPGLISRTFQWVRLAVNKLAKLGFQEVVIATDHGFFLNPSLEAGDVCAKPAGSWLAVHDRMLLGQSSAAGSGDSANLVQPAGHLGLRGNFAQVAVPRAMVGYSAGMNYFHGGLSLQEALTPVIVLRLKAQEKKSESALKLGLSYKQGAKRITTRLPVMDVAVSGQASFLGEEGLEFVLEAHNSHGKVVGEAKLGGPVNPATRIIRLKAGESAQIALKMDPNYEGKFTVKALSPSTGATLGEALALETDYVV